MRLRISAYVLFLLVLGGGGLARAEGVVQVTVLDIHGPEDSWLDRGIALLVERELLARDGVTVIDRRHLDAILTEAGLAESGLLSDAYRAGRTGAVDLAVTGAWRRQNGTLKVDLAVLDAASGATVAHAKAEGPEDRLDELAAQLVRSLAGKLALRAPGIAAPPRFSLPPVKTEELTALTLSSRAEEDADYPDAYLHLRRGIAGVPGSPSLRLALGRLLLRMGEPFHAALSLRRVAERSTPFHASQALALLARLFEHDLEKPALAARCYRELIRRFPHLADTGRSRIRQVELLDRAGRAPSAYLALLAHREGLMARMRNLDEKSRWFGGPYDMLVFELDGLTTQLATRYAKMSDMERSGLPRVQEIHLVAEDGLTLTIRPEDLGFGDRFKRQTWWLIAPEGRSVASIDLAVESGPNARVPPAGASPDSTVVLVAGGFTDLRFGAGNPRRGTERKTLTFDRPVRAQRILVDASSGRRRLYGLTARIHLGPAEQKRKPSPNPPTVRRIVDDVTGGIGGLSAVRDGEGLVMVFHDVAPSSSSTAPSYPWKPGKDADIYLARHHEDGQTEVTRLSLSSESEDLSPVIARSPDGTWRLFWLSNRRDGLVFDLFSSTSKDLSDWSWPECVDLGFRAEPKISRQDALGNLGHVLTAEAPVLHCDRDGVFTLLYHTSHGPEGYGTYLSRSPNGIDFEAPVLLTKEQHTLARVADAPGGGVLAFWLDREPAPNPEKRIQVLHVFHVIAGSVRARKHLLGDPGPKNPLPGTLQPWLAPDGSILAGWTANTAVELPGGQGWRVDVTPHLFSVPRGQSAPEALDPPAIADTALLRFTVPTPDGLVVLSARTRYVAQRPSTGCIDLQVIDAPGMPPRSADPDPVDLPPRTPDRDGTVAVAVLPFQVDGPQDATYLGDAATDLLTEAVSRIPGVRLVERHALGAILENLTVEELSGLPGRARSGRLVGADLVLAGNLVIEGDEATVVLVQILVDSTAIRSQHRWTGPAKNLLAQVSSLAAESAPDLVSLDDPLIERTSRDAASRLAFVHGVSDVLAGLSDRAAGHFLEALRLDLDYPPTRYWLARALEALGEKDGAAYEYRRYLDEQPSGAFVVEAMLSSTRLRHTLPNDDNWVPSGKPDRSPDLLERIYRGRRMSDRVAALEEYVAGEGRQHLDVLLELFTLEADAWFRLQVLTVIRDLNQRMLLRAVAREKRAGWQTSSEIGNLLRGLDWGGEVESVVRDCLSGGTSAEITEIWEGIQLLQTTGHSLPGRKLEETKRAVAEAVASGDPVRMERGLSLVAWHGTLHPGFEAVERLFDDRGQSSSLRSLAARALVRIDIRRAWRVFRPLLLEAVDVEIIREHLRFIPEPLEPELAEALLLDPSTEGWYSLLLKAARKAIPEKLPALGPRMLRSDSPVVRRRGLEFLRDRRRPLTDDDRNLLTRVSRHDPDLKLRLDALGVLCYRADSEEAEDLLEVIAALPETEMRGNALRWMAFGLSFLPFPAEKEGIEAWRKWLRFFAAERRVTGPLLAKFKPHRVPPDAEAILDALATSRDPEVVRAMSNWLHYMSFSRDPQGEREIVKKARATALRVLGNMGVPEHLLPAEGAALPGWVLNEGFGGLRPWR